MRAEEYPEEFITPHKPLTRSATKNLQRSAQTEAETIWSPQASKGGFMEEITRLRKRLSQLEGMIKSN